MQKSAKYIFYVSFLFTKLPGMIFFYLALIDFFCLTNLNLVVNMDKLVLGSWKADHVVCVGGGLPKDRARRRLIHILRQH